MKNKSIFPLAVLLCLLSALSVRGQSGYRVGASRVSTDPGTALFSVALSGYGYPPEGRFSLEWVYKYEAPAHVTVMTCTDGGFYAADAEGTLWAGSGSGAGMHWKKAGKADHLRALAAIKGRLYAVNQKGMLLVKKVSRARSRWRQAGGSGGLRTLAALDGRLYATDIRGRLLCLDRPEDLAGRHHWKEVGKAEPDIISLTARGTRLYAAGSGDTLWHVQPFKSGAPWTEMGRNNGITYDIHVRQLAVYRNRLFALASDGRIYEGRNSTDSSLSATALAISHQGKTIVISGVDLTGFDYSLTEKVKDIVSRERDIPKAAILINASHTHFSPTAQAYPAWAPFLHHPDSLYLEQVLVRGMVKAIEEAMDNMAPAELYFGRGSSNIGLNRSAADPEIPLDHTLDVLVAKQDGRIRAVLFSTPCHAVFRNAGREGYTISANFPGVTRRLIREKTGAPSVFIQGCAGDINPRSQDHVQTGTELAADVLSVMSGKMTRLSGDISYAFDSIHIPIRPWKVDKIKQFRADNSKNPQDVEAQKNVRWADLMLRRYKHGTVPRYLPEYFQFLQIGDWRLVGLSREAVNEYGTAIRKLWPGKLVSVAGYCNDVASYLPKEWHLVARTYEGYGSFFWYGQAGIPPLDVFQRVVAAARQFGNALK